MKMLDGNDVSAKKHRYDFGRFRLIADGRLFPRRGRSLKITPKEFDLLLILLENAGEVVSKGELMERLWPDTCIGENNLPRAICTLRKTLGDSRGEKRYIETVPKRGYRLTQKVREVLQVEGSDSALQHQASLPLAGAVVRKYSVMRR